MHGIQRSAVAWGVALAILLVTAGAQSAHAMAIYTLDTPNADLGPYLGPYATITIDLTTPTTALVTIESLIASGGNPNCTPANPCTYLMGANGAIALNVPGSFSVGPIKGEPGTAGPFSVTHNANISQFGQFSLSIDSFDGFTHTANLIQFSLTNTGGTWASSDSVLAPNNLGYVAASHIFVDSDKCDGACVTGFAGGGGPPIPEPATLAMVGFGLLIIGGTVCRSLRQAKR